MTTLFRRGGAILVEGIMRNISVKYYFEFWPSGSGEVVKIFRFLVLVAILFRYVILVQGIMRNIFVKLFQIWTSGSGGDVV